MRGLVAAAALLVLGALALAATASTEVCHPSGPGVVCERSIDAGRAALAGVVAAAGAAIVVLARR